MNSSWDNFLKVLMGVVLVLMIVVLVLIILPLIGPPPPPITPSSTPTPTPIPTLTPTLTPTENGSTAELALKTIQEKGRIAVAASIESGPFSYKNKDGRFQGFEVELVREFARRWFGLSEGEDPEAKGVLQFSDVSVAGRERKIREDKTIDFLIGSVAYQPVRCDVSQGLICSHQSHASDQQALLVQSDGPITGYCDPDLIAENPVVPLILITGTTGLATLDNFKGDCNFEDIKFNEIFVNSRKDALDAVLDSENKLAVYKSNHLLLNFAINSPEYSDSLSVVTADSEPELYHVWLRQEQEGLRDLIDNTLREMRNDETFKEICRTYFDPPEKFC